MEIPKVATKSWPWISLICETIVWIFTETNSHCSHLMLQSWVFKVTSLSNVLLHFSHRNDCVSVLLLFLYSFSCLQSVCGTVLHFPLWELPLHFNRSCSVLSWSFNFFLSSDLKSHLKHLEIWVFICSSHDWKVSNFAEHSPH